MPLKLFPITWLRYSLSGASKSENWGCLTLATDLDKFHPLLGTMFSTSHKWIELLSGTTKSYVCIKPGWEGIHLFHNMFSISTKKTLNPLFEVLSKWRLFQKAMSKKERGEVHIPGRPSSQEHLSKSEPLLLMKNHQVLSVFYKIIWRNAKLEWYLFFKDENISFVVSVNAMPSMNQARSRRAIRLWSMCWNNVKESHRNIFMVPFLDRKNWTIWHSNSKSFSEPQARCHALHWAQDSALICRAQGKMKIQGLSLKNHYEF